MGFAFPAFDIFTVPAPFLELWAAFAGLIIGSFLNVLALRSLARESLFYPFSKCRSCKHRLGILELVPVLSYFFLKGKCKHCQANIPWHYPLVEAATAIIFAVIVHHFGQATFESSPVRSDVALGMLFFASVLIAVTVTDFKEKLIPHEITYPTILLGLVYSFFVRHDLLGTLAGVGVSYILCDFIAFYGLKVHYMLHPELDENEGDERDERDEEKEDEIAPQKIEISDASVSESAETADIPDHDPAYNQVYESFQKEHDVFDDDPFEVMGGGDAVLAAVLAAWLGWELLVVALVVGFMVGAIMGGCYLIYELKKAGKLNLIAKPALIGGLIPAVAYAALIIGFASVSHMTDLMVTPTVWLLDLVFAVAGTTLGVIWSGHAIQKPFPFGPALAAGGFYAMFMINLSEHIYIK